MAIFITREVSLMVSLETLSARHMSAIQPKYGLMTHIKSLGLTGDSAIDVAGR
jgi:hypothetical protein